MEVEAPSSFLPCQWTPGVGRFLETSQGTTRKMHSFARLDKHSRQRKGHCARTFPLHVCVEGSAVRSLPLLFQIAERRKYYFYHIKIAQVFVKGSFKRVFARAGWPEDGWFS